MDIIIISPHLTICYSVNLYKEALLKQFEQQFFHMMHINLLCLLVKCSLGTDGNGGHLLHSFLKLQILEYCLGMFFLQTKQNGNPLSDKEVQ